MGIMLVVADRSKPGVDEVLGQVLSGGSFWVGNSESEGHVEGDPLYDSEVTRVGNKLGIYDVEGLGITLGVEYKSKLGVD